MISSEIFGSISKIQDLFIAQIYPQFQDFEASFYSSRMSHFISQMLLKCCFTPITSTSSTFGVEYSLKYCPSFYRIFTQILSFILQNILWFKTSFTRHLHEFEAINTQGLAKEALFLAPKASIAVSKGLFYDYSSI